LQRILSRGDIEALDHNAIPRLAAPERGGVFSTRAARLRQLAQDSSIADYLRLIAILVDAQHAALSAFHAPDVPQDRILLAQTHGMPPLQATGIPRDPAWRGVLLQLLNHMEHADGVPGAARDICAALRLAVHNDPAGVDAAADALLGDGSAHIDVATAPFLMAALQVYGTDQACRFDAAQLPVVSPFGVCPLCGSLPVASLVRVGGQYAGYRYLCCALCSTQWHVVRVTCTHCEETQGIAYRGIEAEGRDPAKEAARAETCDNCHTYRKIFSQEKDLYVEPIADDLGSLSLDMLVGQEGYQRASGNPFLWQGQAEE
jgi:FdhE protein